MVSVEEVVQALREEKNILLYGPPACGKTRLMHDVQKAMSGASAGPAPFNPSKSTGFLKGNADGPKWWVTFHQSYAYEDFVIGLRTVPGPSVNFQPVVGPMLEAALYADKSGKEALIVVDEINRGNTSRILGEAITIMEKDKRAGDPYEVQVRLPHVPPTGLSVKHQLSDGSTLEAHLPANFALSPKVFFLAAMNSVDRTVAPLDAALRRRFLIIEMGPDIDVLKAVLQADPANDIVDPASVKHWKALAIAAWVGMNQRIKTVAGKDFMLGHGYLTDLRAAKTVPDAQSAIALAFNRRIMPQLEEEFKDNEESLFHVLRSLDTPPEGYPVRQADTEDLETARPFRAEITPWPASAKLAEYLNHLRG
jgi:5-methylcytosine-specific restriction enzyme B